MTKSLGIYKYQSEKCTAYFSKKDMMHKRLVKYFEFIEEYFIPKNNKGFDMDVAEVYITKIVEGKRFLDNLIQMLQNQYNLSIDITYHENIFAGTSNDDDNDDDDDTNDASESQSSQSDDDASSVDVSVGHLSIDDFKKEMKDSEYAFTDDLIDRLADQIMLNETKFFEYTTPYYDCMRVIVHNIDHPNEPLVYEMDHLMNIDTEITTHDKLETIQSNEPKAYVTKFKQVSIYTSEQKLKELEDLGFEELYKLFMETCDAYANLKCFVSQWLWIPEMMYVLESMNEDDPVMNPLYTFELQRYWNDSKIKRKKTVAETDKTKVYVTEFKRFSDFTTERKYKELEDIGFEELYKLFLNTCEFYGKTIRIGLHRLWVNEMDHVLTSMFYEDPNGNYLDLQELRGFLKDAISKHTKKYYDEKK